MLDYFFDNDPVRAIVKLGRNMELEIRPQTDEMILCLPFKGSERICWECGGERFLILAMTIKGKVYGWKDVCDPFEDTSMSRANAEEELEAKHPRQFRKIR